VLVFDGVGVLGGGFGLVVGCFGELCFVCVEGVCE